MTTPTLKTNVYTTDCQLIGPSLYLSKLRIHDVPRLFYAIPVSQKKPQGYI